MKKLLFILLACLPLFGLAKDKKDNSNPKYLAGAITMEDGKVTFNHEIKAPSLSKEQLYKQMLDWEPCHWTAPASTTSILSMWLMGYAA